MGAYQSGGRGLKSWAFFLFTFPSCALNQDLEGVASLQMMWKLNSVNLAEQSFAMLLTITFGINRIFVNVHYKHVILKKVIFQFVYVLFFYIPDHFFLC